MSKQTHNGESDRRQTYNLRARAELFERFDEACADEYDNRAEALRALMREYVDDDEPDSDESSLPLPDDEPARTIIQLGRQLSNSNNRIPIDMLESEACRVTNMSRNLIEYEMRALFGEWIARLDTVWSTDEDRIVQIRDRPLADIDNDRPNPDVWSTQPGNTTVEDLEPSDEAIEGETVTDGGTDDFVPLADRIQEVSDELGRPLTQDELRQLV